MEPRVEVSGLKPTQQSCPLNEHSQVTRSKWEPRAGRACRLASVLIDLETALGPHIAQMGPRSVNSMDTCHTQAITDDRSKAEKQGTSAEKD